MKRLIIYWLMLGFLAPGHFVTTGRGADADEEARLLAVVQSDASLRDKDAACARLKYIGTARSVPALAGLLTDERLSHSARYVLECLRGPEAGRALLEALEKTRGLTKAGILNSLGIRAESNSTPLVVRCLGDADPAIASAAATALGKMGGGEASKALDLAVDRAVEPVRGCIVDALLLIANRLMTSGESSRALAMYQRLEGIAKQEHVRLATYRGIILASGERGRQMLLEGIAGDDGPRQAAALQLVREWADPEVTPALAELLPKVTPAVQIALLEGLAQRGDARAAFAIIRMTASKEPSVVLPAINALGILGDASAVPVLAELAASKNGSVQKAARQSLVQLRRGKVGEALLAAMASANLAVQVEVVRALGERGEAGAVPKLLAWAEGGAESTRLASLKALAMLGDVSHVAPLTRLVVEAKSEAVRSEARLTLETMCQRLQSQHRTFDVEPIIRGLSGNDAEARIALLPVCRGLTDARIRVALRQAMQDMNRPVQQAAMRTVCDTRDVALIPELMGIAQGKEAGLRLLALRGLVRLVTQEEGPQASGEQRLKAFKFVLGIASAPEEKRLALAGLANLAELDALQLVVPMLEDATVRAEAAQAAIKIAGAVMGAHPEASSAALKKALPVVTDTSSRKTAAALLQQIQSMTGYITAWQVAGPYSEKGKNYAALFDAILPPETDEAKGVIWKPLPAGTDPQRPWLMDLLKALGGEQCTAYVRTRIYSEAEQAAVLELGSDDGVKVWWNGKMVYANNTARPLAAGSDKIRVTLKSGWNPVMFKVTQNNQAWEYCARLVKSDGSPLEGLRFDVSFNSSP